MKALLVAVVFALLMLGAASGVSADATSDAQAQKAVIDQIRAQLGSNLADAMAAQQQLKQSLLENAAQQADLQVKIADVQAKIADLEMQIANAQRLEAILALRIDSERAQLRQLARAIYEQPGSVLVALAQAQSLSDLLTRVADAVMRQIAGLTRRKLARAEKAAPALVTRTVAAAIAWINLRQTMMDLPVRLSRNAKEQPPATEAGAGHGHSWKLRRPAPNAHPLDANAAASE